MPPVPLSVLDLSPLAAGSTGAQALRNTLDLARLVDGLGYRRYWLAEHHNLPSLVSTAPEVLIGHVASVTTQMRVGSGGIMLPNHAPLHVAETFRVLAALHPGRIDLGLGRAPGSDSRAALALRGSRERRSGDDFPELLAELLAFGRAGGATFPAHHPLRDVRALPDDVPLPPVWLLGSSDFSARLAAEQGLGFGFAHHFSPEWVLPACRAYRGGFQPSAFLPRPHLILTVNAVCAETDEAADRLASSLDLFWLRRSRGRFEPIASVEEALAYPYSAQERALLAEYRAGIFVGGPETVRRRIMELVAVTGADEVMISTMTHDHAARRHSYELLAEAFAILRAAGHETAA
ncbi:MAG: LLM class flavin-dependent oxidoreductase [Verrucomicrobia bacterium]|nr:LLM class flavin-dependent oxidoreductase [Verrucomicrobiota bacterium]